MNRVASTLLCLLLCFSAHQLHAQAGCTAKGANRSVTICSPAEGASVGTTFRVQAATHSAHKIRVVELYLGDQLYAVQHTPHLDVTINVASGAKQTLTVIAHDESGIAFRQTVHVDVQGTNYAITPANATLSQGETRQFSATRPTAWTASCGTIAADGTFTAPLASAACVITGKATDGSGAVTRTNVAMSSPVTISPASSTTPINGKQQFSANLPVTWSASCGSISSDGLFTAPASANACTITATANNGTPYTDAVVNIVAAATSAVNYTTFKGNNQRTGLQASETQLTPVNVKATSFGQLFTTTLDGWVWAQPLYMSGLTIGSATKNVVYAATANGSVYAIDGNTGAQLWKKSLLGAGETAANGKTLHSSVPIIGVTGTPVIDPATSTIYAVTQSVNGSGQYFHRLHALSLTTGAEKFGGPVTINTGGWNSSQHLQRSALLLANGNVYIAFSGNEDVPPYHGWLFAYSASTLAQVAVFNVTPGGTLGGVWMAAGGPAADSNGNIFLATGNGDWNGSTQFGQSEVKLGHSLGVLDYFTPIPHVQQSQGDKDLGSAGPMLLPNTTGAFPHELVQCSKLDTIYILNRDNLGKIGTTTDRVIQHVDGQLGTNSGTFPGDRCFGTPAFWNNNIYFIGNNDAVKQFSYNPSTGLMSTTPVHKDTYVFGYSGAQPVVSSNGGSNAVLWAIDWKAATLRAYNAANVANGALYVSAALGSGIKFTAPTVANGHVYVGVGSKIVTFGLKSSGTTCTPPTTAGVHICSPTQGGSYTSPLTVSAAAKGASGTVSRMELWIDGKKINNFFSDRFSTTVALAVGGHAVTVNEVDSAGALVKSPVVNITIH